MMEDGQDPPPSYEDSVSRNAWKIIAKYLPRAKLLEISTVSKEVSLGSTAALWSDPRRYFGEDDQDRQVAFYIFKQSVKIARFNTCWHTHTLDLSILSPDVTYVPQDGPTWLHDLLSRLPNLRCFLVDNLSSLDGLVIESMILEPVENINIRLLRATSLANILRPEWLQHLIPPSSLLTYLDLSNTKKAGGQGFLRLFGELAMFRSVSVLKLRRVGLTDPGLKAIAQELGTQLWSLDVRQNHLTTASVVHLLNHCCRPPAYEKPPSYISGPIAEVNHIAEDSEETIMREILRDSNSGGRRKTGLTHLYISKNQITFADVVGLILSANLFVLDCGDAKKSSHDAGKHITMDDVTGIFETSPPAAYLRYLRINHSFITSSCDLYDECGFDYFDKSNRQHLAQDSINLPFDTNDDMPFMHSKIPMLNLRELVLTGVPSESNGGWVLKGLQAFFNQLAFIEYSTGKPTTLRKITLELSGKGGSSGRGKHPWKGDVSNALSKARQRGEMRWSGQLIIDRPVEWFMGDLTLEDE